MKHRLGWLCAGFAFGVAAPVMAAADGWAGLERFSRAWGWIQTWYVDAPDGEKLVDDALHAMARGLDPHSTWYSAAEWREAEARTKGTEVGIGADLGADPCGLRVLGVSAGGPADRAGLRAGDCIVAVGGQVARDLAQLDGPVDEALSLEVDQGVSRRTAVVLRTHLTAPVARWERGKDDVGWLRLSNLRPGALEQLDHGLAELGNLRALVLDLRQNPGGEIEEAVLVADRFLGAGEVVKTEGRGPGTTRTWTSSDAGTDLVLPLVVLVDGGTASAAEIVAGALRARGRASLVGVDTWGKGSVQTLLHSPDGGVLQLTISRYSLPDGSRVSPGAGLHPDHVVALDGIPSPLLALRERVRAVPGLSPADRAALLAQVDAVGAGSTLPGTPSFAGSLDQRAATDPQLAAALRKARELPPAGQ